MPKKKLEVVELNKEEKNIIIKEDTSLLNKLFKKYNKLFLLLLFAISLAVLITAIILTFSNLSISEKLIIKEVSIDTDLNINSSNIIINSSASMTEETAQKIFENSSIFKKNGQVLLMKTVSKEQYIIKFYSDFTAIKIMKNGNSITKIKALDEKTYGISENGITDSKAETVDITKTNEKEYQWGTVIYYSDGSAEIITNSEKNNMYVRNANDITDNYISNNKISYLKDSVNVKNIKLNYYYDGTIEVVKNNRSYLVRDKNDLDITSNDVIFKNQNEATIIKTISLDDGKKINYYSDGGAIIIDGNKTISVRKSNSIVIKNNKIFEIVDNIYVEVSKTVNNENVIYYTNGSAIINNYNGQKIYVEKSSNIKYQNNKITSIGNDYEILSNESNVGTDNILQFETAALIKTNEYIAIVPKDNILLNSDGSLKTIITNQNDTDYKPIIITNNTNDTIKYRLVIEKSPRTTLNIDYIRYQLSYGDTYVSPKKLNEKVWKQDNISDSISIKGTNYILLERTLEPTLTDKIVLMLWTDYDTIPNTMQNKYFYGTIKIYAWQEIESNI